VAHVGQEFAFGAVGGVGGFGGLLQDLVLAEELFSLLLLSVEELSLC
jgi:hypothetical protein